MSPGHRLNKPLKGRGSVFSVEPCYLGTAREAVDDGWGSVDLEPPRLHTTVTEERIRGIINRNESPDLPFNLSINPYRGCEHGCVYCYARPAHAFMDLSPGLDFESRLFSKPDAPEVLRRELAKPHYRCETIALGANTDAYQPIEKRLKITRHLLEVLAECSHPVTIVSKSALIERDVDLLAPMAEKKLVQVFISVTTLDRELARRMEPRAAAPQRRIETQRRLNDAGIPTGVMFAPVIPALNDHELETILEHGAQAGCRFAGTIVLRLPREVKPMFKEWLAAHYPLKYDRVMNRIRDLRGGHESDAQFGRRMKGQGVFARLLAQRFERSCQALGMNESRFELDTSRFRAPGRNTDQLELF
ncbi:MAG: PA0069 family radical SAM protein [Gammaproteobacteria bacterium]